jgi:D-arabinose 5-phosphate isomerase GutQ
MDTALRVVITGAGACAGIGRATAIEFARLGANPHFEPSTAYFRLLLPRAAPRPT